LARFRRVQLSDGVSQEVERFVGDVADRRLRHVNRQFEPSRHAPHDVHGLGGRATTTLHEVVSIVDDARLEPLLVSQHFPAEHESSHVEVR